MKRTKQRRPWLARPADGLLPLALLAGSLLAQEWEMAMILYMCALAIRLLALGSASGLRVAFALQPSYRQVRGSVKMALLLQLAGGALLAAVMAAFFEGLTLPWERNRLFLERGLPLLGAGLLLNIEHVFYEYLYAAGDGRSAGICRGITAGLTLAGLLLTETTGGRGAPMFRPVWLLAATGAAALTAAVIGCAMGGGLKGRLNAGVLRCVPRSLPQAALYPLLAFALLAFRPLGRYIDSVPAQTCAAFFAGLAVCELCRTPFRRSRLEAGPLNRALLIVCGVALAAALPWIVNPRMLHGAVDGLEEAGAWTAAAWLESAPVFSAMLALAAACAFALYGRLPGGGERE